MPKTILDALKDADYQVRVSDGGRWLVWDNRTNEFVVLERAAYARRSTECYRGDNEASAVKVLLAFTASQTEDR